MDTNFSMEIWKKLIIPDLNKNEQFEISNFGRIKSLKTGPKGFIIKASNVRGYHAIVVKLKSNKSTTCYVHKLVAEHFIEKDYELQRYVIHMDFDKNNNKASNLRWVTKQTMFAHQKVNPNYKRGIVSNAKLTETEVIRLKLKLQRNNNRLDILAKEFGVTHTQISRIKNGENWAHVKVPQIIYKPVETSFKALNSKESSSV